MNILLTAIGSMSADSVIKSLNNLGHTIIGCDIFPSQWIPTSLDVDTFYQVPNASDKRFIKVIDMICEKHAIDFIIPLTDPEVDVLNDNVRYFKNKNVIICISNDKAIEISRNKLKLHNYFNSSNLIKTIPTFPYESIHAENEMPLIAKKINGRSSEGLRLIKNRNEIEYLDQKSYIYQPLIKGDIITVDFIRDVKNNTFSIPRKELIRTKNGAGITVEIEKNELLKEMANEIGYKLDILGCINIEFIFNGEKYFLMDINPRFSAGIAFSQLCGYDFVKNHINCFKGKTIDNPIDFEQNTLCKKHTEVIM